MSKSIGGKIVKYTFKAIGYLLVFGTIGILLWRMFSSGNPKIMKTLMVNEATYEAWQAAEAEGRDMVMYSQRQDEITRAEHNHGYFSVTQKLFIEDANQVQVLFRYNNSTLRHLQEDYDLPEVPGRDEDLYDLTLYVAYDLTPLDTTDNAGNDPASVKFVRYYPSEMTSAKKNLYNYRKFVFDGVDMTVTENPVLAVYVDIYYKDDVDYEKDAYGTLCIYDYLAEKKPYELTGSDKDALEAFKASLETAQE